MSSEWACRISSAASDAIGSAFALPVYIVLRVVLWWTLPVADVTLILSDGANVALLLLAAEQNRQGRATERGVRAIVEADPRVDSSAVD